MFWWGESECNRCPHQLFQAGIGKGAFEFDPARGDDIGWKLFGEGVEDGLRGILLGRLPQQIRDWTALGNGDAPDRFLTATDLALV